MKKTISVISSLIFLFISLIGNCGYARAENESPFDSLNIGVRGLLNVNRNDFHEFWEPGIGGGGFVATPFYFGDVRTGMDVFSYSSITEEIEEYYDWHFYLGWEKRFSLLSRITWDIGFDPGIHYMMFDNETEEGLRSESEFGVDVTSGLSYSIGKKWFVDVSVNHQLIFTRKRINLTYVSAGISYSLETPGWLREILE